MKKYFQTAMRVLCVLSVVCLLGTAGASDCGQLDFSVLCVRSVFFTATAAIGAYMGGLMR